MNSRTYVWFCAFAKRLLQKPLFLVLLLLFPFAAIGINQYCNTTHPLIQVVLYNEGKTSLAADTIANLTSLDSTIQFYEAASAAQVYTDVKKTKAECGYIFTKDYRTEHILDARKRKHSVKVIESPASILTGSINEFIFTSYFKFHNQTLLTDYLQQPKVLKEEQKLEQILKEAVDSFEHYAQNDAIIQPKSITENTQNTDDILSKEQLLKNANTVTKGFLTNLARGILSILILLASLCGGMQMLSDRRKGLFAAFAPKKGLLMKFLDIITPAILMALSGFAGLALLPAHQPLWKEAASLLLYVFMSGFFSLFLTSISCLFPSSIPILTLGALIFAPVFMDFSAYAKVLRIPKYLFINTYYLNMATGSLQHLLRSLLVLCFLMVLAIFRQRKQPS